MVKKIFFSFCLARDLVSKWLFFPSIRNFPGSCIQGNRWLYAKVWETCLWCDKTLNAKCRVGGLLRLEKLEGAGFSDPCPMTWIDLGVIWSLRGLNIFYLNSACSSKHTGIAQHMDFPKGFAGKSAGALVHVLFSLPPSLFFPLRHITFTSPSCKRLFLSGISESLISLPLKKKKKKNWLFFQTLHSQLKITCLPQFISDDSEVPQEQSHDWS